MSPRSPARSARSRGRGPESDRAKRSRSGGEDGTPRRRTIRAFLAVALAFALGFFVALVRPDPLRPSADAAVAGVSPLSVRISSYAEAGGGVEVGPVDGGADTLLVLVPGARVRPHAYTWIGVALAPIGVRTLIPAMPLDLPVLAPGRIGTVLDRASAGERRVVLAGHSLGGHVAASWLERNPTGAQALALLAADPGASVDLSDSDLPTLILSAANDGLVTRNEIDAARARLPVRTGVETIDGAVHAFFGRYGTQRGDGLPTVPRERAENEIAGALEAFIVGLR